MTTQPPATPAEKRAVWDAIAPPARLFFREIADATGIDLVRVWTVFAEGAAAGKMKVADDVPGFRWIERIEA